MPLLWGWLCGQQQSVKYDLLLERSIGLGITDGGDGAVQHPLLLEEEFGTRYRSRLISQCAWHNHPTVVFRPQLAVEQSERDLVSTI